MKRGFILGLFLMSFVLVLMFNAGVVSGIEPYCNDSDGGKNYYEKGEVTTIDQTINEDGCWGIDGQTLAEYYCEDGEMKWESQIECEFGCSQGACFSKPQICKDTDPDNNLLVKGNVTIDNGKTNFEDVCSFKHGYLADKDYILQFSCENNKPVEKYSYCENGFECYDGKCIESLLDVPNAPYINILSPNSISKIGPNQELEISWESRFVEKVQISIISNSPSFWINYPYPGGGSIDETYYPDVNSNTLTENSIIWKLPEDISSSENWDLTIMGFKQEGDVFKNIAVDKIPNRQSLSEAPSEENENNIKNEEKTNLEQELANKILSISSGTLFLSSSWDVDYKDNCDDIGFDGYSCLSAGIPYVKSEGEAYSNAVISGGITEILDTSIDVQSKYFEFIGEELRNKLEEIDFSGNKIYFVESEKIYLWFSGNKIILFNVIGLAENDEQSQGQINTILTNYLKEFPPTETSTDENTSLLCSSGCKLNNNCVPVSYRTPTEYCSPNGNFAPQLQENEQCNNNFECGSNLCVDNQCVEAGLFARIINWFRNLFS